MRDSGVIPTEIPIPPPPLDPVNPSQDGQPAEECSGEILEGSVHRSWGGNCPLVGRTLDLTAAYKQHAVSPDQGFVRVLTAYDPNRKVLAFFLINAVPFGATSSGYGFNRVAKSLWHIMVSLGAVWTTQYFDDFPNVELCDLASNSRSSFFMRWAGSMLWMARKQSLTVQLSKFLELNWVSAILSRAASRCQTNGSEYLVKNLGQILDRRTLSGAEASTLHGQLNFAQGQYFGCSLKPAMVFLQKILRDGWSDDYQEELAVVAVYTVAAQRSRR